MCGWRTVDDEIAKTEGWPTILGVGVLYIGGGRPTAGVRDYLRFGRRYLTSALVHYGGAGLEMRYLHHSDCDDDETITGNSAGNDRMGDLFFIFCICGTAPGDVADW